MTVYQTAYSSLDEVWGAGGGGGAGRERNQSKKVQGSQGRRAPKGGLPPPPVFEEYSEPPQPRPQPPPLPSTSGNGNSQQKQANPSAFYDDDLEMIQNAKLSDRSVFQRTTEPPMYTYRGASRAETVSAPLFEQQFDRSLPPLHAEDEEEEEDRGLPRHRRRGQQRDDEADGGSLPPPPPTRPPPPPPPRPPQHASRTASENEVLIRYIDMVLYVVSGVILIFVMDQFVKIGVLIGSRRG